ncbi:DUF2336 domain-containing protein [Brevundimonas naejangsanensis]|uniref:DUF2336 domain-containing protein n=1 Tax=Brevundimonas naejangsanensis TaxID=588932 RepID=UPI003D04CBB5
MEPTNVTRNGPQTHGATPAPLPLDSLEQLVDLAKGQPPERQHGLLIGVADLYRSTGGRDRAPQALGDAFIALVRVVEADIRQVLSERLADADWAPVALVRMLAADAIEIARPVIAGSPLLQDDDLLTLLAEASLDHRIQVALRPGLGAAVARAIISADDPTVLTALASNRTAALCVESMSRLVSRSRELAALRAPLARHPQMTPELGARLYQWVGEALRQAITERFTLDPARLAEAAQAVAQETAPADVAAARLTAKLQASDQLRPATLIRALREDRLEVFIHALSRLARLDLDQVRRALRADTTRPLLLACSAAGLDRAAFPAVLSEVRRMNNGFPHDPDGGDWRLAHRSAAQAASEFQLLMAPQDGHPV